MGSTMCSAAWKLGRWSTLPTGGTRGRGHGVAADRARTTPPVQAAAAGRQALASGARRSEPGARTNEQHARASLAGQPRWLEVALLQVGDQCEAQSGAVGAQRLHLLRGKHERQVGGLHQAQLKGAHGAQILGARRVCTAWDGFDVLRYHLHFVAIPTPPSLAGEEAPLPGERYAVHKAPGLHTWGGCCANVPSLLPVLRRPWGPHLIRATRRPWACRCAGSPRRPRAPQVPSARPCWPPPARSARCETRARSAGQLQARWSRGAVGLGCQTRTLEATSNSYFARA